MAFGEILTFEAAFDEYSPVPDKKAFKDSIIKSMAEKGELVYEVPHDGGEGDLLLKTMDAHVSRGYNVFKSSEEYQSWLAQSLYEPTDEEVLASLKEQNGAGT